MRIAFSMSENSARRKFVSAWKKILVLKKQTLLTLSLAVLLCSAVAPDAEAIRKERTRRYDYSTQAEQQLERLRYVMLPLLRVTNHRIASDDIRVSIVDDTAINAASAAFGSQRSRHHSRRPAARPRDTAVSSSRTASNTRAVKLVDTARSCDRARAWFSAASASQSLSASGCAASQARNCVSSATVSFRRQLSSSSCW